MFIFEEKSFYSTNFYSNIYRYIYIYIQKFRKLLLLLFFEI